MRRARQASVPGTEPRASVHNGQCSATEYTPVPTGLVSVDFCFRFGLMVRADLECTVLSPGASDFTSEC